MSVGGWVGGGERGWGVKEGLEVQKDMALYICRYCMKTQLCEGETRLDI